VPFVTDDELRESAFERRIITWAEAELFQKPHLFWLLGFAFARKANAQVIVNKAKWKEKIEGFELFRKLAKQVLSQLSYTPPQFQSCHEF
jgi:hypothetical protein